MGWNLVPIGKIRQDRQGKTRSKADLVSPSQKINTSETPPRSPLTTSQY